MHTAPSSDTGTGDPTINMKFWSLGLVPEVENLETFQKIFPKVTAICHPRRHFALHGWPRMSKWAHPKCRCPRYSRIVKNSIESCHFNFETLPEFPNVGPFKHIQFLRLELKSGGHYSSCTRASNHDDNCYNSRSSWIVGICWWKTMPGYDYIWISVASMYD